MQRNLTLKYLYRIGLCLAKSATIAKPEQPSSEGCASKGNLNTAVLDWNFNLGRRTLIYLPFIEDFLLLQYSIILTEALR